MYIRTMARPRTDRESNGARTGPTGPRLRRQTDPTLLVGHARVLTQGAVVAVLVGVAMAISGIDTLAPVAFTLSSVVTIGLLSAARRADTAARPDHLPDRSRRTKLAAAAIIVLAAIGTGLSAWNIAADLAR